ncbi:MAG: bifunctional nuclease domain-containing protein [Candidatus Njordarchaeales archaeon]
MTKNNEFQREKYLRVVKIRPLFPIPLSPLPPTASLMNPALLSSLTRPVLELKLEDGSTFRMGGIPSHIALEIWELLETRKAGMENVERVDPRLTLSQVVVEIAEVQRVRISDILPQYNVYVAEVDILPEGFGRPITLQMVPSHAILIGLRAKADIYVAKDLVEDQQEEMQTERSRDESFYDI